MSRTLFAILLLLACSCASAHISSNGFVSLQMEGSQLSGTLELAIRDAELAVGVDSNGDGSVTWGEALAHQPELISYIQDRLTLSANGNPCVIRFGAM